MPGRTWTQVLEFALGRHGFITTDDAREIGVDSAQLRVLAHRGQLERISRGVYRMPAVPPSMWDEFMQATLWARAGGAISHESALDLLDLCDVNPSRIHVTVPHGFRTRQQAPRLYRLHREPLEPRDVTELEGVRIVTPERAIRGAIRNRVGAHLARQAIGTARARGFITRGVEDELSGLLIPDGRRPA